MYIRTLVFETLHLTIQLPTYYCIATYKFLRCVNFEGVTNLVFSQFYFWGSLASYSDFYRSCKYSLPSKLHLWSGITHCFKLSIEKSMFDVSRVLQDSYSILQSTIRATQKSIVSVILIKWWSLSKLPQRLQLVIIRSKLAIML